MSLKLLPQGFFFTRGSEKAGRKGGSSSPSSSSPFGGKPEESALLPLLKLETDREIYRPGDLLTATVEVCSPVQAAADDDIPLPLVLVDNLGFEIKGIEKLDTQWFSTQKPLPGSKQRRGEHLFLDCCAPSIVSKVILSTGSKKIYTVRVELPKTLPPSYRGTTIRYFYYVRVTFYGRWLVMENGHQDRFSKDDLIQLEARSPLQIWVTQNNSNLPSEGIFTVESPQIDIYWKEKDADCEWTKANEVSDGLEEGYESSRDDVSSVSSYNPTKGATDLALRSSLSLQSMVTRLSVSEAPYSQEGRSNLPYVPLPRLSITEIVDDPGRDSISSLKKLNHASFSLSPNQQRKSSGASYNEKRLSITGPLERTSSEGFIRGRSYNIRIDDQVLLRFSPRNSDSAYYFGDMIGGTLTFFHGEGARRCLEVSVTLEMSEVINQRFVHPSRRSSPTIVKVQSDHHEVVADLTQTSFLFTIPVDGPMSFSTPYISVQWALRFEFFTTAKHVDLKRYGHPLLVEEREKGDWVLPIIVYAPPSRPQAAHTKAENSSLGSLWVRT